MKKRDMHALHEGLEDFMGVEELEHRGGNHGDELFGKTHKLKRMI